MPTAYTLNIPHPNGKNLNLEKIQDKLWQLPPEKYVIDGYTMMLK